MQSVITLNAEPREKSGKNICKKYRKEKKIPAIIYGEHKENVMALVDLAEVKRVLKSEMGENAILELALGKTKENAMIKKLQLDYLQRDIIHIDFIRVDLDRPVEVDVHIVLQGEPIGVKQEGGLFEFPTRTVTVRCLPLKIPHEIKVDVSNLHAGHSIKVSDLEKIEGVEYVTPANTVICLVARETEEEATSPAEAAQTAGEAASTATASQETGAKKE